MSEVTSEESHVLSSPEALQPKYDVVIVLCPSEPVVSVDGKYSYTDVDKDKQNGDTIYLGGDVRMKAAVKLSQSAGVIILVGGSKAKVDGMMLYLKQELGEEPMPAMIRLESDPDTLGNFRAIKGQGIDFEGKSVAVLTNDYHLPRAMAVAQYVYPGSKFTPVAAESLLSSEEASATRPGYTLRKDREEAGLKMWVEKRYRDQQRPQEEWKSICYDQDQLSRI